MVRSAFGFAETRIWELEKNGCRGGKERRRDEGKLEWDVYLETGRSMLLAMVNFLANQIQTQ